MSKADKLTCPHCSGVLDGKISQALVENATYTMTIKPGPDGTLIQAHTLGGVIQELGNLMAAIWNDIGVKGVTSVQGVSMAEDGSISVTILSTPVVDQTSKSEAA